jgi:hypothetical protein
MLPNPGECNHPCPGNGSLFCGGSGTARLALRRRQIVPNLSQDVLTVYSFNPNNSTSGGAGGAGTGSDLAGSGGAGSGSVGSGSTGSGGTISGNAGSEGTGSGSTGSGGAGTGSTGSGNTGSEGTGSGSTGSGSTGSGGAGSGGAGSDLGGSGGSGSGGVGSEGAGAGSAGSGSTGSVGTSVSNGNSSLGSTLVLHPGLFPLPTSGPGAGANTGSGNYWLNNQNGAPLPQTTASPGGVPVFCRPLEMNWIEGQSTVLA